MGERTSTVDPAHPLVEGRRLDQPTFHAHYQAMPPGTRAELIDGVVHMPSPGGRSHSQGQISITIWLAHYVEHTPGVEILENATTILGRKNEPQPDLLLRVLPENGGQTWDEQDYIRGAPELVVEVAKATRFVDLGPKLRVYEQAGVLEYVVRAFDPDEVLWFAQDQGSLTLRKAGEDGFHRSTAFPGLWLDPRALVTGDWPRLRGVVDLGLATPEHAGFVARLAAARREDVHQ